MKRPALNRRSFLKTSTLAIGACGLGLSGALGKPAKPAATGSGTSIAELPVGGAPMPVPIPHFPDRLHAFVWRNWQLVPSRRMAEVVGASRKDIERLGSRMGLASPPRITSSQQRRSALTVIRRNWHLLPYEQLLQLLGWNAEQMAFSLREDDFLFVKLGNLKPQCEPLRYRSSDAATLAREQEIARLINSEFPQGVGRTIEPLFDFVAQLSRPPKAPKNAPPENKGFSPRYCYSYFALYGDPLLEPDLDPYPDGYLARLAAAGVDGVWLQALLARLAPFPWNPQASLHYAERLENLHRLVRRAARHGIKVYLYLNEPRSLPLDFFTQHPELKGVTEGDYAALCTSAPGVVEYLTSSVASICQTVPDLGGFFTISGSENLTSCWSHGGGKGCPRCGARSPSEVIAEVNTAFYAGIQRAGFPQKLLVWDWGWNDAWVPDIIARLPRAVMFMSVSEWSMPIRRGNVETTVGEYSISTVGPGPRAQRHWEMARKRGLKTAAKVQCGNTWELSAVPYIPAVANVARHAANLCQSGVDGLMLGWTLGGYPSPNLEAVAEMGLARASGQTPSPDTVLGRVATRRFGEPLASAVVQAWNRFSQAFSEFPFHGSLVYNAPMQLGPANPLWSEPTGYHATMVGFPYDDLDAWRAVYPPETFIGQFEKVADGFDRALADLVEAYRSRSGQMSAGQRSNLDRELNVAEAAAIHFRSTANQARFVMARRRLKDAKNRDEKAPACDELEKLLRDEIGLAKRLHAIQSRDSRIGFEASNQYYYVPSDLAEKVVLCQDLLVRWLPAQRRAR